MSYYSNVTLLLKVVLRSDGPLCVSDSSTKQFDFKVIRCKFDLTEFIGNLNTITVRNKISARVLVMLNVC